MTGGGKAVVKEEKSPISRGLVAFFLFVVVGSTLFQILGKFFM